MKDGKYTQCAIISCNVSHKKEITSDILVDILLQKREIGSWIGHIDVFFNELPQKIFIGFIEENNVSFSSIKILYDNLPKVLQGKNFKGIYCYGLSR